LAEKARQQSEEKAVGVGVINPVVPQHGVLLPLRDVADAGDVRVLVVVNLLPAAVDVAEDVCRMEGDGEERDEAEERGEADNQSGRRRLGGSPDDLITFPEQEEEGRDAKPGEQFSRRARVCLSAFDIKETGEQVNAGSQPPNPGQLWSMLFP
jgi:hypothetical protein